uniref:Uncharacterized protein n=1 Tax=Brassica campestris TaxID=3711 RepID=M4EUN5_BRACM
MSSTARNRKSSRLQRRAPPPLKINPSVANWKIVIPLLPPTESPPQKPPTAMKREEQRWGKRWRSRRFSRSGNTQRLRFTTSQGRRLISRLHGQTN